MTQEALAPHELTLHGHRVGYRSAGRGPVLLLLHGITDSSETWESVTRWLSERFTLIAPDLLGHGASATPRGDYSLGAHASGVRDVLTALQPRGDRQVLARGIASLDTAGSRQAFVHTLRAVVEPAASASTRTTGFISPP